MLFNSIPFFIFFPIVVLAYYLLPDRLKQYWLLAASYFFYMSWNAKYAILLLGCTLVTYFAALCVEKIRKYRAAVLVLAMIVPTVLSFVW